MLIPRSTPIKPARTGQAAVESLMVIVILVLIIFSGIELGRGVALRQSLDSATEVAARLLSLDPTQWAAANSIVTAEISRNMMGGSGVTATMQVLDSSGAVRSRAWLESAPFQTVFAVEVTAPFTPDIPFLSSTTLPVTVRHYGVIERILP